MLDTKLEVTNLITPLINSFKLINNEWKHLLEIGISDYLHSQTEKYYLTNTFIHRSEKVKFDDIYFPIKADYKELTTSFNNLNDIFENYKNITIVGTAGSGKTTLMKYIFLNSIRTTKKIPILIELRFLNDYDGDFEKLICEKILKSNIKPSESTFKRALSSGSFIFLLDGYDEIFSNKKQELNRQIELFVDSYSENNFFITTRPGSGIEGFPRFYDFRVCGLNNEDVEGFLEKIVESDERKNRILEIIKDEKNSNYIEYLRNPLLLSMFILAFESHPEIPSRKSSFYRNVFDTLYSKHDGITKNSFPREKLTKLEREEFEKILNIFSYLTMIEGKYSFTSELLNDTLNIVLKSININCVTEKLIYDLQTTISILVLDGFEYYFPHRSMQEYFTAQFISNLPTDKKQKAYNNLQAALIKSSTDHSFNLWSICNELDESAFITFFIIPQLKLYEKKLSIKENRKLLDNYFEIIEPSIYYANFEDEKSKEKELVIYRRFNFYSSLIDFTEAYNYDSFAYFTNSPKIKPKILLLSKELKNETRLGKEIILRPEIKEFLIKEGISSEIRKIKKSISERIKYFEEKVKNEKMSIDNILDI